MEKLPKEGKLSREAPQDSVEAPEKLGPYELVEQVPQSNYGQGELYLATHEASGASALVFKPVAEPEQNPQPRSDWQVRYLSSGSPGYLALEVVHSPWFFNPGQPRMEEVVCAFEDVRAAVARMAQALLDLEPRPPRLRLSLALAGGAAVCGLLLALVYLAPGAQPQGDGELVVAAAPETVSPQGLAAVAELDTFTIEGLESVTPPGLPGLVRPLPREPFKGQKRPPCTPRSQAEIIGACWVIAEAKAPCPEDLYEHQGRCYLPILKAQPPPQALGQ